MSVSCNIFPFMRLSWGEFLLNGSQARAMCCMKALLTIHLIQPFRLKRSTELSSSNLWKLLGAVQSDESCGPALSFLSSHVLDVDVQLALLSSLVHLITQPGWLNSKSGVYEAWCSLLRRQRCRAPACLVLSQDWCMSELSSSQR